LLFADGHVLNVRAHAGYRVHLECELPYGALSGSVTRSSGRRSTDALAAPPGAAARETLSPGSGTKRLLCILVQSTSECKTRGEERGTGIQEVKSIRTTRNQFHSQRRFRAPSKPCLIATFLLRFQRSRVMAGLERSVKRAVPVF